MSNYITYHLHTELSLLDSCTNFKLYVDKAKELGQTAICFTEHGNTYNWVEKKLYCEEHGIKYLHGCEVYLTKELFEYPEVPSEWFEAQLGRDEKEVQKEYEEILESGKKKIRDNYHTILIAKNYAGLQELNTLIDLSTQADHMYYKPRISFNEFKNISDNIIKISACLASPLNKLRDERLIQYYDYLEIQPHVNSEDQKEYNKWLYEMAIKHKKPLIAGTDTHSINTYKAECRSILQKAKHIEFTNEDEFDLTYKSYNELVDMFRQQNSLPEEIYLEAIENTNVMAASVEDFELDKSFKYPKLYEDEEKVFKQRINKMYQEKLKKGIITKDPRYVKQIREEMRVFKKIGMVGFMLFMSELVCWCWDNGIPIGFCRGSCGGSVIAYITDIIDVDPIVWNTVFSRFCNEHRTEIGDIDIDIAPSQRHLVYEHIIDKFGIDNTAYILAVGTISDKGTIDEIGRALSEKWAKNNVEYQEEYKRICETSKRLSKNDDPNSHYGIWETEEFGYRRLHEIQQSSSNPYSLDNIANIKKEYEVDPEATRKKYPDLFYYFDGLVNTAISQSMHPAGIVVAPLTLPDNYGTFWQDGKRIMSINMEEIHEVSLVKYDLLGLKNVEIIKDCCELAGIQYPRSHTVNWEDDNVWDDIITSPVGIFQFESQFAFDSLKKFKPRRVNDLSLVNAALRPSGTSYRDRLLGGEINKNPSELIDDLLKQNKGFLVFQEDTIAFLQNICGLSGGDADNVRRAIGRKQKDRLEAAMPQILDGYCKMSPKSRDVSEKEAKEFLQIIEDSSNYQFGFNHSTGYSMIGYTCAMLRYYYPEEFIAAYLNNANNEDDIRNGTELARIKGVSINPVKFRYSGAQYTVDKKNHALYKGCSSVKFLNSEVSDKLYAMKDNKFDSFLDLLDVFPGNSRMLSILIKLNYFSEFGQTLKLLKLCDLHDMYGGKKIIKKDKCGLPLDLVQKYAVSETAKQYRFEAEGMRNLIREFGNMIPESEIPLRTRLEAEAEYMGYISYTNPKLQNTGMVLDVNTKYTPRIQVYMLDSGETITVKVPKAMYQKQPFDKSSILKFYVEDRPKSIMVDGEWQKDYSQTEKWVKNYIVKHTDL